MHAPFPPLPFQLPLQSPYCSDACILQPTNPKTKAILQKNDVTVTCKQMVFTGTGSILLLQYRCDMSYGTAHFANGRISSAYCPALAALPLMLEWLAQPLSVMSSR